MNALAENPATIAPLPTAPQTNGAASHAPRIPYRRFAPERVVGDMTLAQWDDFLATAQHKYHYVYGKVVQMAGASFEHNQLQSNFAFEMRFSLRAIGDPCEVLGSDQRVFVRHNLYYFPDLVVVCGNAQLDERDALRNPVAIVEVLSPTTEADDRTDKFREYQSIETLRHYVLVDQNRVAVTHFEKQETGLWAIRADLRDPEETLTLTLADAPVAVPLPHLYRGVVFPAPSPAATE